MSLKVRENQKLASYIHRTSLAQRKLFSSVEAANNTRKKHIRRYMPDCAYFASFDDLLHAGNGRMKSVMAVQIDHKKFEK